MNFLNLRERDAEDFRVGLKSNFPRTPQGDCVEYEDRKQTRHYSYGFHLFTGSKNRTARFVVEPNPF
jgi:hypothetical protein